MKIAVSATGKDLNCSIDPRFGRCAFYIVLNTENMSFEAFENENMTLSGGAGIQAAGFLASKGVQAVLTGNCGPNAMKTFSAAGIQVFTGMTGTISEAVEKYRQGSLVVSTEANVPEKGGLGQVEITQNVMPRGGGGRCKGGTGRGMGGGGRGIGGGRCMGGSGRGMGMGQGIALNQTVGRVIDSSLTKETSVAQLKKQAAELQQQVDMIREKIKNIEQH